jgi:hsp70-interacting protein
VALTTSTTRPTSVRAKAVYALSSSLKHWPFASSALSASSSAGYNALKTIATDSATVIRRKAAFLIGTLIMQSGEKYEGDIPKAVVELIKERTNSGEVSEPLVDGLKREGVIGALLVGLKDSEDVEYEENAIRALVRAVERDILSPEEVAEVKSIWTKWGSSGQAERGLDGQDGQDIEKVLA